MSMNEVQTVATVPPEVSNFLSNYHEQAGQLAIAKRTIDDLNHIVATQEDQITDYREMIKELSAKSDYYMRLSVEMRTHFKSLSAMCNEAEKCFVSGPYRNNGSVPKEALQVVADDINGNVEAKDIPGFLTNDDRKERLEDLKGEPVPAPRMPKGKGWPAKDNGASK